MRPKDYATGDPSRARCDALTARLTGAPAPAPPDLMGAALDALQAVGAPFRTIRTGKPHLRAGTDGRRIACVSAVEGKTRRGRPWLALRYTRAPGDPGQVFVWLSWAEVPSAGLTPGEIAEALREATPWRAAS